MGPGVLRKMRVKSKKVVSGIHYSRSNFVELMIFMLLFLLSDFIINPRLYSLCNSKLR